MQNTEANSTSQYNENRKQNFVHGNMPILLGGVILCVGSVILGYTVGHRQGLTVVGYDADAEQLVEVVKKQKNELQSINKTLNLAVQERDVAVTNSNDMYAALTQANSEKHQIQGMSEIYRDVLRARGGLSLTVQNLKVKPLPENVYEYELDLIQVSPNNRLATGNVVIRLIQGTEVLIVPLENNQFNFEDYARLTGRWTMPKGYRPQFIEVRLDGSTPVVKRFSWQQGKPVENSVATASEIPKAVANSQ